MDKNKVLEITVDGKAYQVLRITNNHNKYSKRYICRKDNKYGVFSPWKEEMIIPFEYDNITYLHDGIYLLSKSGKMGIFHSEPCYDNKRDCYYNSEITIPCEYDYIHPLNSYNNAFIMQKNKLDGITVQAYLTWAILTTEEYTRYRYFEEDYLELVREDKRVLIDVTTGEVISNDKSCSTFAIYNTAVGIVIHELKEPDINSVIFIRNFFEEPDIPDQKHTIEFKGDFRATYEENECGYPLAKDFKIIHPDGSIILLNNEGIEIG